MSDSQTFNVHTNTPPTAPDTASPAALQARMDTLKKLQGAARFQMVATAVVAVAMFAAFTAGTYTAVQNNFSETAVSAAFDRHAPGVMPQVTREVQRIIAAVTPTYRKVIAERFPQARKEIGEKMVSRLYAIPEESAKEMGLRLQASFDRVLARIEPELIAAFPNISEEQRRDLLTDAFHNAVAERNEALSGHIERTVVNEMARTHDILEKFALPVDDVLTTDLQLQKQLSKTIMLLVDQAANDYENGVAVAGTNGNDGSDVFTLFNEVLNPMTPNPGVFGPDVTGMASAATGGVTPAGGSTTGGSVAGAAVPAGANAGGVNAGNLGGPTAVNVAGPTTAPSASNMDLGGDK